MGIDITHVFDLLTQSPGDLVYFLVVSLPMCLILVYALIIRNRVENRPVLHHVMTGSEIIFFLQIIVLISSLFSPNSLTKTSIVFIITESLAITLMIIWLTWTVLDDEDKFIFNGVSLFLTNGLILAAVVSVLWIIFLPEANLYKTLGLISLWCVLSLILIMVGLVRVIKSRPKQWAVAVIILVVLAVGFAFQVTLQDAYLFKFGAVRFFQMLSLPWTMFLIRRFERKQGIGQIRSGESLPLVDTKPALVEELLKISLQETAESKSKAVARAISMSVISDICYLAKFNADNEDIQLLAGYDLIRECYLQVKTLKKEELPQFVEYWQENKSLMLSYKNMNTVDAQTFAALLRYQTIGNLLAYPISLNDKSSDGGVIILSPYTNKQWDENTLELLNKVKKTLSKVMFSQTAKEKICAELDLSRMDLDHLQNEKNALTQVLIEKQTEINSQESAIKQLKARIQIEKLATVRQIEQLQKQINALIAQKAEYDHDVSRNEKLQEKIAQLSSERVRLEKELINANARIQELEIKIEQTGPIRLSMETKIVSLDAISANLKQHTAHQIQQRYLNFEIINPDGRQMVRTDPVLLHTALIGLLENAIKASESGSKINLKIKLSLETGMLILEITDFGEGLSPIEQQALFSADPEKTPGIGSIHAIRDAIRAIRLLQGKIWLKSKKYDFTTFRVQVPVRVMD